MLTAQACSSASLQNGGSEERGFTWHEMLDEVGLIHMNGHLFDQNLGRFLQADPIIQSLYAACLLPFPFPAIQF